MIDGATWSKRECPCCGAVATKEQKNISSHRPAEFLEWKDVRDSFIGLRAAQVFFSYQRCINCELLYSPKYFSTSQLDELYSLMPDNLMGENEGTATQTQDGYANHILKYVRGIENYVELGPDIGLVAKRISHQYPHARATLVEPNEAVRDQLIFNSSDFREVNVVNELGETLNLSNSDFDLVVGIHVLDHLLNPSETLGRLYDASRINAHLCVVVHNEKSLLRFILGKKWPPFCLQHPQIFNRRSIRKMLNLNGWETIVIRRTKNYFSLRNLFEMLCLITNAPKGIVKIVPNVQVPIKLGNIIVIAKKIEAHQTNNINQ